jgi:hypothetical protein
MGQAMNKAQKVVILAAAVLIAGILAYPAVYGDLYTPESRTLTWTQVGLWISAVLVLGAALVVVLHKRKPS